MKRINIIVGHYGSGKTEFAINLALKQESCYNKSVIVDMDTVNPYFRTKDVERFLVEEGVDVIAPQFASTNVDLPSLPAEINSAFETKDRFVVLDVGGDDEGATALGRYNRYITQEPYEMLLVMNAKRPLTQMPEEFIEMISDIERTSRLKVTGLVNNTNISYETTVDDLLFGQEVAEQVSEKTGLPLRYICGTKEVLNLLPDQIKTKRFALDLKMWLPF